MKKLEMHELMEMYNDFLDEVYPDCKIAGYEYNTSRALYEIDPTAYHTGFADWLDSQLGETIWELPDGTYTTDKPV